MERLLYRSRASEGVGTRDVFDIIDTSERNNPIRGVTGFLLYDSDRFLQLLEGPPLQVEGLVARIADDERHEDIEVIWRETAEERWFPDWSMKRLISFDSQPAVEQITQAIGEKPEGRRVLDEVEAFLAAG